MVHSQTDSHLTAYEHVITHLRSKGIRITETRKAVTRHLINSSEHPSAEMIYKDLHPTLPHMSLATVYNNLKVLVDEGFVTEIKRNNDPTTYYDFMGQDHLNVICECCGKITDLELEVPSLEQLAQEQTGYHITREVLTLYGFCPECQPTKKASIC